MKAVKGYAIMAIVGGIQVNALGASKLASSEQDGAVAAYEAWKTQNPGARSRLVEVREDNSDGAVIA